MDNLVGLFTMMTLGVVILHALIATCGPSTPLSTTCFGFLFIQFNALMRPLPPKRLGNSGPAQAVLQKFLLNSYKALFGLLL